MSIEAEHSGLETRRAGSAGRILVVAGVACLIAAGLLLWSHQGGAVFGDFVLSALAWCF